MIKVKYNIGSKPHEEEFEIESEFVEWIKENYKYRILNSCFYVDKVRILENTLKLGLKLGYTLEELEQAYWRKNKINWERIEGVY